MQYCKNRALIANADGPNQGGSQGAPSYLLVNEQNVAFVPMNGYFTSLLSPYPPCFPVGCWERSYRFCGIILIYKRRSLDYMLDSCAISWSKNASRMFYKRQGIRLPECYLFFKLFHYTIKLFLKIGVRKNAI